MGNTLRIGELKNHLPDESFVRSYGPINWWDYLRDYEFIAFNGMEIPVQGNIFVVYFDEETKEDLAFTWTDEDPSEVHTSQNAAKYFFPDL
jgi:hypothetical protein